MPKKQVIILADISDPFFIFGLLHIVAALSFAFTLAFVIKLYLETDKGWYWLTLVISTFLLALSQWVTILFPIERRGGMMLLGPISEGADITGAILLAVSFYGMYKTMKDIRKRVE